MRWSLPAVLLASTMASAQVLDLGSAPRPPAPGDGAAALALAGRMGEEAERLDALGTVLASAQAALRRAARAIILTGETAGEPGSIHIVTGATIAARLKALDERLADSDLAPSLAAVIADLDVLAGAVPGEPTPLDRALRDALAPLGLEGGWVAAEPGGRGPWSADEVARWAAIPGVTAGGMEALDSIGTLLAQAAELPAYRAGAEAIRGRVRAGAAAAAGLPAWVTGKELEECGHALDRAFREMGTSATRDAGLKRLGWLAGVGRLCTLVDRLPSSNETRKVRDALLAQMSAVSRGGGLDTRPIDNLERAIALALARSDLGDERDILRQVRPAWRELWGDAVRSEQRIIGALPRILEEPGALTDPGIVSILSTHTRALEDLSGMRRASQVLGPRLAGSVPTGPAVPGINPSLRDNEHALAAERILALGQDMLKNEGREQAREALRALGDGLIAWHEFPGERDLRDSAPGSPISKVLAGRERDLLAGIERARREWLLSWARGGDARQEGRPLESLGTLLSLALDAMTISALAGAHEGRAQPWPGWQLAGSARRALAAEIESELHRLTPMALDRDPAAAIQAIRKAHSDLAVQRLAARLERDLPAAAAPLLEVAGGPPMDAWGEAWRADLAAVCRYTDEWAEALDRNETARAAAIKAYAALRAMRANE